MYNSIRVWFCVGVVSRYKYVNLSFLFRLQEAEGLQKSRRKKEKVEGR